MKNIKQWLVPAFHPLYGRLLLAELRQLGFSDEQVFSATTIEPRDFASSNTFLTYDVVQQLIGRAILLTEKPWLGVEQRTFGEASVHGIVGFGAISAVNLGEALRFFSRFLCLREKVLSFGIFADENASEVKIIFYEDIELGQRREFMQGTMLANVLRLLEGLAGHPIEGITVRFTFPKPEWHSYYQKSLHSIVEFGASECKILLPASTLLMPCIAADRVSFQSSERECERLLLSAADGQSFAHQVREFLMRYKGDYPSQNSVAECFHISTRTLMRRLKSSGVSFQQLLDDSRKEVAQWYLLNTTDSLESIAVQLGYADASNFARTFRRWFGKTPGEYRKSTKSMLKV